MLLLFNIDRNAMLCCNAADVAVLSCTDKWLEIFLGYLEIIMLSKHTFCVASVDELLRVDKYTIHIEKHCADGLHDFTAQRLTMLNFVV